MLEILSYMKWIPAVSCILFALLAWSVSKQLAGKVMTVSILPLATNQILYIARNSFYFSSHGLIDLIDSLNRFLSPFSGAFFATGIAISFYILCRNHQSAKKIDSVSDFIAEIRTSAWVRYSLSLLAILTVTATLLAGIAPPTENKVLGLQIIQIACWSIAIAQIFKCKSFNHAKPLFAGCLIILSANIVYLILNYFQIFTSFNHYGSLFLLPIKHLIWLIFISLILIGLYRATNPAYRSRPSWAVYLTLETIALLSLIVGLLLSELSVFDSPLNAPVTIAFTVFTMAAMVFLFVRLHILWNVAIKLNKEKGTEPSVGHIGTIMAGLLIPVYNIYWAFVVFSGLSNNLSRLQSNSNSMRSMPMIGTILVLGLLISGILIMFWYRNWPAYGIVILITTKMVIIPVYLKHIETLSAAVKA